MLTTSEEFFSPHVAVAARTEAMLDLLGIGELPTPAPVPKAEIPPVTDNSTSIGSNTVTVRLSALVGAYDHQVIKDAVQLRTYVMHKLIEMSHCGDPRQELKALELLGKISEVGLFTTQTEVTVTHKTSDELASALRERITRLIALEVTEKEVLEAPEEELDIQDVELEEMEEAPEEMEEAPEEIVEEAPLA